jgi:hypothetical protein
MTANQRRPGFRLPWQSDSDDTPSDASAAEESATDAAGAATATSETTHREAAAVPGDAAGAVNAPTAAAVSDDPTSAMGATGAPSASSTTTGTAPASTGSLSGAAAPPDGATADGATAESATAESATAEPTTGEASAAVTHFHSAPEGSSASGDATANGAAAPTIGDPSPDFLRDLVAAMRGVADEARHAGLTEIRGRSEERTRELDAEAEERRNELRARADVEIAGVGEWADAERERIRLEAEQRVESRKALLEEQLAAETARAEAAAHALRARVEEYERELDAFHAQLSEITDPAAFAAAAKRMPRPPALDASSVPTEPARAVEPQAADANGASTTASDRPGEDPTPAGANAASAHLPPVTLADRIAALGAAPPAGNEATGPVTGGVNAARSAGAPAASPSAGTPDPADGTPAAVASAPTATATDSGTPAAAATPAMVTTEIVVKGLGSFGAITGFRQALSGVEGIDSVALSLGQTGEFIFRATHAAGVDLPAAIARLEGDGATVESRPDGTLAVTLDRPR